MNKLVWATMKHEYVPCHSSRVYEGECSHVRPFVHDLAGGRGPRQGQDRFG